MTVRELEKEVSNLKSEEMVGFRRWFEEKYVKLWDQALESDVKKGALDKLAEQALRDFNQGKCKEL